MKEAFFVCALGVTNEFVKAVVVDVARRSWVTAQVDNFMMIEFGKERGIDTWS